MFTARSPIRSRSALTLIAATMTRRSIATGCCSARSLKARSSMPIWRALMSPSPIATSSRACRSRVARPRTACARRADTVVPCSASSRLSSSMPARKWRPVALILLMAAIPLAEAAGHVVFGQLLGRVGEDLLGPLEFDELAEPEERGHVRDARCLLHVVGDDDDRVGRPQLVDQFFDALRS